MSEPIYVIACTEEDMLVPVPPQPRFARDGSCAHRDVDPAERCRCCFVEMDDLAYKYRAESWFDSL